MKVSPASLKQTFNCVHIIQLDSTVVVQRHSPGFHLGNGLQAGVGNRGLKRGAWNLPCGLTHPITWRGLQMSFLGQNDQPRPSSGIQTQALLVCSLAGIQAPCPPFCPVPVSWSSSPRTPRLHSANPINKELRKFIRKWAFYRFRESLLPTPVTEKG